MNYSKLAKLCKMPREEILGRLAERSRTWRERAVFHVGQRGRPTRHGSGKAILENARHLVPGTGRCSLEELARGHEDFYSGLVASAAERGRRILAGNWRMLGHQFDLAGTVDWHRDPITKTKWPRRFYADVPLKQDETANADVKYVWELGRQQYCSELARAWLLSGKNEFAQTCRRLILSWIDENPRFEGVHWTSALELAMRSIAWIWSLAALADWEEWRDHELEVIAGALCDHAEYLRGHLSFYSSPYNHLIGEATALWLIGLVTRDLPESSRWRQTGRRVLLEHGPRQFYADGFCVEQATGYHFYTLGFLVQAILAARAQGEPMTELETVACHAFRAGAAMRQPNGRWPAIGDVDSARSIPVHPGDFWDFGSLCALGAVLFDDPGLKAASDEPGEELYWLMGTDGVQRWHELELKRLSRHVFLKDSGYVVGRSDGDWVLFDAGPIAEGLHCDGTPSAAHGHLDVLQVLFCHKGRPVLIDPGMPYYFGDREWVRHFRSPSAHNTIQVEGAAPASNAGPLAWSHVVDSPDLDATFGDRVCLARARAAWRPGVSVERNVLWIAGRGLWVADYLEFDSPRRVRWNWQLSENVVNSEEDEPRGQLSIGNGVAMTMWDEQAIVDPIVCRAFEGDPTGWKAPGYGEWQPGCAVRFESEVTESRLFVTFVGTSPLPLVVETRGRRVMCGQDKESRLQRGDSKQKGDDAIIWSLWEDVTTEPMSELTEYLL